MGKKEFVSYITENQLSDILESKYPHKICPECSSNGIYAGCIQTAYDSTKDENILLSFDVFCKDCGAFLIKWDNTNRDYFMNHK